MGHYRCNVSWDEGRRTRDEGRGTRDEGRGTRDERGRFGRVDDSIHHPCFSDVPFEFVGKVARAGAMAEASDIECCSTSRHAADLLKLSLQRTGVAARERVAARSENKDGVEG